MSDWLLHSRKPKPTGRSAKISLLLSHQNARKIGQNLDAEGGQIIDATGLVVLPGGIDVHTHFNIDVGVRAVDDFSTGTIAAAFGGTTSNR